MAERTGQQLGNYRLIRLLGRGGFAEVYLGEHVRLNSYAAVKVLNTQLMGIEAESFQREGLTIARLVHPHIIRVFDYDLADGTPFLIMDYAPNGTLRSRHAKGVRVPLAEIVFYVRQVASALQYAHSEKVIHRDIKPENMLLGRNNEILLSDFGIATMSQSSRYQNTVDIVGTVAYMAPEQIQGKPHPASDQYSLGIVVYEWLSGVRPFQGSFTEIAVQHAVTPPPPLREKVPDIPPDVEQVLQIALAKHVHQRFASVQAFANAFEQASQTASPPVIVSIYEPPAAPGGSATVAASPVPAASPTPQSPALPTIPASSTAPQRG
ncbi:MAG TPA: protein kinase, partial [Ktedonobacteraceae bacterium]|nr:protein kinase [Ktedonobacteraceae bacterium]